MNILNKLNKIWEDTNYPFLIRSEETLKFSEIINLQSINLSLINPGDVVALIGDFNSSSILTLLKLIDLGTIIVPLTYETSNDHEYFFKSAFVDVIINGPQIQQRLHNQTHELISSLKKKKHAGLILFTTGTTGRPKAILHDLTLLLARFETPRPALRTISFLLFDHIGGINTLFHTLFNQGVIIVPETRSVNAVLDACSKYEAEVLPTTPTFLRMMLISGVVPNKIPNCLRIITYGTEQMDQVTLNELCSLLPDVDFRQTFGMSELGILRVKSKARNSLFMKIGGKGIVTRVVDGILQIHSKYRMLGYLNAPSPFDVEGWYDTKDIVECKGEYYKIIGRINNIVNVGGLKFLASDIEKVVLEFPNIAFAKVITKQNPITGQHIELIIQPIKASNINRTSLMAYLKSKLQPHMVPKRIQIEAINISHRFKKI